MKLTVLAATILITTSACAQPGHRGGPPGRYEYHSGIGWVIPTIIGGALVYQLANRPIQSQPQVIYVEKPVPTPLYTTAPPVYERKTLWDQACGCYVEAYVPK